MDKEAKGELNVPDAQALQAMVHQEIWQTLPEEEETLLKEIAEQTAEDKGVPLRNPLDPSQLPDSNTFLMQYFEWYLPDDGQHWRRLMDDAGHLRHLGAGAVWMPPFCKATGTNDVGYGIYDLYDLGEFEQKGKRRTKYGTREDLQAAIASLHGQGIQVYADVVLNHKAGADESEVFKVVRVDEHDRNRPLGEPHDIEGWTRFTFPGRQGAYSEFVWGFQHFTAVNFDQRSGDMAVFKIQGDMKDFSKHVSDEQGNADYLMFADIDYRNKDVIDETLRWGQWICHELQLDGMRLDAIKHIDHRFMEAFIRHCRLTANKPLFFVGEYWNPQLDNLEEYLHETDGLTALFDVSLHYNFVRAAGMGRDFDLRQIFDGSLVSRNPSHAVTFVDNHDSQPGQALESWVDDWFKPLAYALILLRKQGYPCVFYGDYYGIGGEYPIADKRDILDRLLGARLHQAYGEQVDYFDHANTIGWVRLGDASHPGSGLACVLCNGEDGHKRMCLGELNGNTTWFDVMGGQKERLTLDEGGWADFPCRGGSVSVWIRE